MVYQKRGFILRSMRLAVLAVVLSLFSMFLVSAASVTISTPGDNGFAGGSFNISATTSSQVNITNFTVTVALISSGSVVFTSTNTTLNNQTAFSVVWPSNNGTFSDGAYNVTFSVDDIINLSNTTSAETTHDFTLDNTVPNSTITLKDTNNVEQTEYGYGTEVVVDCGAFDSLSGLNVTTSVVALKIPALSSYSNLTISEKKNASLKVTIQASSTRDLGDYSVKCHAYDHGGNANITVKNFTVVTNAAGLGNSAFQNPNFVAPIAKRVIGRGTTEEYGVLPEEGDARLMAKQSAIMFTLASESHTVSVLEVDDDLVTLEIASEPFTIDLRVNETKQVDVNADGTNDLEIYLHKVHNKKADLVFKEISTASAAGPAPTEPLGEGSGEPTPPTEPVVQEPIVEEQKKEMNLTWLWIVLGVIVLALILFFVIRMLGHRSKGGGGAPGGNVKFTPRDLGGRSQTEPPAAGGNPNWGQQTAPPQQPAQQAGNWNQAAPQGDGNNLY